MAGRRSLLGRLLLAAVLFFTVSIAEAQAADIPVIIKVLPGVSISNVVATLSGTLIDSIPGSDIHLVNVPSLTLLQSTDGLLGNTLQLLGIDWYELNNGVTQPGYVRVGILQASGAADWYKNQPAFQLIRAGSANQYSTGRGIVVADINSRVDVGHPALRVISPLVMILLPISRPARQPLINPTPASSTSRMPVFWTSRTPVFSINRMPVSWINRMPVSWMVPPNRLIATGRWQ
jgi:hypothetical protein